MIIFTGARGAHKRYQGCNYLYHRVQNSYQIFKTINGHYSSIIVYMSTLKTLTHTIAKGSTFSISSPFGVTKSHEKIVLMSHRLTAFRSQPQWTRMFISLTTPVATGTQLGFKRD